MIIMIFCSILVYVQINNFLLNKTTSERYGFKTNDKSAESLSVIFYINCVLQKFIYLHSKNSKETNPSLIGELSKGESKKSSRFRKKLGFCDYLQNCFIMCYMNSRQKLELTPTESRNSLLMNA